MNHEKDIKMQPKYALLNHGNLFVSKVGTKDELQNAISDHKQKTGADFTVFRYFPNENTWVALDVYE